MFTFTGWDFTFVYGFTFGIKRCFGIATYDNGLIIKLCPDKTYFGAYVRVRVKNIFTPSKVGVGGSKICNNFLITCSFALKFYEFS